MESKQTDESSNWIRCRHHPEPESESVEAAAPDVALLKRQQPGASAGRDRPTHLPHPTRRVVQQAALPAGRDRRAGRAARAAPPQQLHPRPALGDGQALQTADPRPQGQPALVRHPAALQRGQRLRQDHLLPPRQLAE